MNSHASGVESGHTTRAQRKGGDRKALGEAMMHATSTPTRGQGMGREGRGGGHKRWQGHNGRGRQCGLVVLSSKRAEFDGGRKGREGRGGNLLQDIDDR